MMNNADDNDDNNDDDDGIMLIRGNETSELIRIVSNDIDCVCVSAGCVVRLNLFDVKIVFI